MKINRVNRTSPPSMIQTKNPKDIREILDLELHLSTSHSSYHFRYKIANNQDKCNNWYKSTT